MTSFPPVDVPNNYKNNFRYLRNVKEEQIWIHMFLNTYSKLIILDAWRMRNGLKFFNILKRIPVDI